jgi:hypothetical protein
MDPEGQGWGHKGGGTIFVYVYRKESSGKFQSNFVQIFLARWEFKFIQMKVQVLFKEGIITKVQKKVGSLNFFSREPQ